MSKIGYLEGTDPLVLDKLVLQGHKLISLGDDKDGYSRNLLHISRFDRIDLVLARFYKLKELIQSYGVPVSVADAFERCREAGTEIVVVASPGTKSLIREELRGWEVGKIKVVPSEEVFERVVNLLNQEEKVPRSWPTATMFKVKEVEE